MHRHHYHKVCGNITTGFVVMITTGFVVMITTGFVVMVLITIINRTGSNVYTRIAVSAAAADALPKANASLLTLSLITFSISSSRLVQLMLLSPSLKNCEKIMYFTDRSNAPLPSSFTVLIAHSFLVNTKMSFA